MLADTSAAAARPSAHRVLADRLIGLADDTDRAGLRREAALLLATAYAVLDGDEPEEWFDE